MPLILDGKTTRIYHEKELRGFISKLSKKPKLSIIQVGDDERSSLYIEQKKKCAERVGIEICHIKLSNLVPFEEIKTEILRQNADDSVSGTIVQLPLPEHLEKQKIIDLIETKKDVDGLTTKNQILLDENDPKATIPATARAIMSLLSFYKISVKDKKVAVLGRSILVGRPAAIIIERAGGKVTVCHSKTQDTRKIVQNSEIVIVAIGKPQFLDDTYISKGQIIIDVGINSLRGTPLGEIRGRKLVGDVNFDKVAPKVLAISPVPGGVGPMTVISLMENVFQAECGRIVSK